MVIGNFYVYDTPSALKEQLESRFIRAGSSKDNFEYLFGLLYSAYSVPNILLPFLGGTFVDRVGTSTALVLFSALILGGQVLFTLGVQADQLWLMLLGRAIYGLGGDNLTIAQSTVVARWFDGQELAFALGITVSISRLGSVFNNSISPYLAANSGGVAFALWFGAILCAACMSLIFILMLVERRYKSFLPANNNCTADAANRDQPCIPGALGVNNLSQKLLDDEEANAVHSDEGSNGGSAGNSGTGGGVMHAVFHSLDGYFLPYWIVVGW
jgi:MFS family permease